MVSLLKFLDSVDGMVYAARLLWPGRAGRLLRVFLFLTALALAVRVDALPGTGAMTPALLTGLLVTAVLAGLWSGRRPLNS